MSNNADQMKIVERNASDTGNPSPKELGISVEQSVVDAYKKIEDGVVGAYKKVEEGAVNAYKAVEDFCVDKLFRKDGETVEEAKERLQGKK